MSREIAISINDHYDNFIRNQISNGRFASENELFETALREFELKTKKAQIIVDELVLGENSEMLPNFDFENNLKKLHKTFVNKNEI